MDFTRILANVDGDAALELFKEDFKAYLRELEQALRDGDAEALVRIAHTLKSPLGALGMDAALAQATVLEEAGNKGDL